ncbi:hypothetical protein CPB86DRAFT_791689 [Serendipita vermifera]|nr:hypothetical protein CPB86DRAFT_791689 [Serendipita vermifera]
MSLSLCHIVLTLPLLAAMEVAAKPRVRGGSGGSSTCYDDNGNVVACPVNKTAIIAGVVVGGVVLILVIIAAIIFFNRRKKRMRAAAGVLPTHRAVDSTEKPFAHQGFTPAGVHPNEEPGVPPTAHINDSRQQGSTVVPPGTYAPPAGPPPS